MDARYTFVKTHKTVQLNKEWPLITQILKNHLRGGGTPGKNADYDKRICVTNMWSNLSEGMGGEKYWLKYLWKYVESRRLKTELHIITVHCTLVNKVVSHGGTG